MKYQDNFCVIETTERGTGFYADRAMHYFEMSNAVAEYLIKRLNEKGLSAYSLIDYAEKLNHNRELKLYNGR